MSQKDVLRDAIEKQVGERGFKKNANSGSAYRKASTEDESNTIDKATDR